MQRLVAYPFLLLLLIWYFTEECYVRIACPYFFRKARGDKNTPSSTKGVFVTLYEAYGNDAGDVFHFLLHFGVFIFR